MQEGLKQECYYGFGKCVYYAKGEYDTPVTSLLALRGWDCTQDADRSLMSLDTVLNTAFAGYDG